jgi:hypothetical protein
MAAPAGALVRLYYDSPVRVAVGDYLLTKTGRSYLVVSARVQARGKHTGRRQHLACLIQEMRPPEGDHGPGQVHPLRWYARRRRSSTGPRAEHARSRISPRRRTPVL